jgi:hypothetical protein
MIETADAETIAVATTGSLRSSRSWIVPRVHILSTHPTPAIHSAVGRSATAAAGANHTFELSVVLTDYCTLDQ